MLGHDIVTEAQAVRAAVSLARQLASADFHTGSGNLVKHEAVPRWGACMWR